MGMIQQCRGTIGSCKGRDMASREWAVDKSNKGQLDTTPGEPQNKRRKQGGNRSNYEGCRSNRYNKAKIKFGRDKTTGFGGGGNLHSSNPVTSQGNERQTDLANIEMGRCAIETGVREANGECTNRNQQRIIIIKRGTTQNIESNMVRKCNPQSQTIPMEVLRQDSKSGRRTPQSRYSYRPYMPFLWGS